MCSSHHDPCKLYALARHASATYLPTTVYVVISKNRTSYDVRNEIGKRSLQLHLSFAHMYTALFDFRVLSHNKTSFTLFRASLACLAVWHGLVCTYEYSTGCETTTWPEWPLRHTGARPSLYVWIQREREGEPGVWRVPPSTISPSARAGFGAV